jgi:hypothetical protein
MYQYVLKFTILTTMLHNILDVFDLSLEPVLFKKDLCSHLKHGVSLNPSEVLDKVTSQDLVEVHFFGECLNCIWVWQIVQCALLSEGITPFQCA